ncbi:MAG: DUF3109 family protein [Bacteroidota bacterium]|nr:DUF3109 family protein [Bacteroidota bacterium]
MYKIGTTLVSDELRTVHFCCDLAKCKGACCVEGDAGAPLEEEEISFLEDFIDEIKPFMTPGGVTEVENNGVFDYDSFGVYVTPLINGKECAYIYFDSGIARCAIEKAYTEKKIPFPKPISCHLYPVRLIKIEEGEGVNYHKWYICQSALDKGLKENLPLYRFLETALIRKYGKEWYKELKKNCESH